jgi:hypothetical protein
MQCSRIVAVHAQGDGTRTRGLNGTRNKPSAKLASKAFATRCGRNNDSSEMDRTLVYHPVLTEATSSKFGLGEAKAFTSGDGQERWQLGGGERKQHTRTGPTNARCGIGNPRRNRQIVGRSGRAECGVHCGLRLDGKVGVISAPRRPTAVKALARLPIALSPARGRRRRTCFRLDLESKRHSNFHGTPALFHFQIIRALCRLR